MSIAKKKRRNGLDECRFIFTAPTFVTEKIAKEKREFYIPRLNRERSLYGTEFEIKLRNGLTQKAIARECAEWIRKKAAFNSNSTQEGMQGFMNVDSVTYMPLNGFTTVDIGCDRGCNVYNMVNKFDAPFSSEYMKLFTEDGKRKQKWESYETMADAKKRLKEVEYKEQIGTFVVPKCKTLDELLKEYVDLYGKEKWALSTYSSNVALIKNYISPKIGTMKISDINTRVIERFYQTLLKTEAVPRIGQKTMKKYVTSHTVRDIHKILRSCFNQAVKWELMAKNPASNATVPKVESGKRDIWPAETLFDALHVCNDTRLAMALNLSFCCSLRMGEMLGLTWDCVDVSEESIQAGTPYVYVEKELQRVKRAVLEKLDGKDVIKEFPTISSQTSTMLVLKRPKTESSIRKVFMPVAVAKMLVALKQSQDETMELLGSEYQNYNLVFAGSLGLPTEGSTITSALKRLIKENDLPPVVFHSFRHASITYKLKLNGGDIKAVQGDSGHAQAKMVTDAYSHILDDDRKNNAQLFQEAFYDRTTVKEQTPLRLPEGVSQETLAKMLENPEIAALLGALAKKL